MLASSALADSFSNGGVAGGVTGTGTTNAVPKFTGSAALGDAGITDNGTTVDISGDKLTAGALVTGSTGVGLGTGGEVRLDHQGVANTLLQLYSTIDWDGGADQSRGLLHIENTNSGSTGGMLSIQNQCAGSSGSCFEIRIDGNNPDIEFIEDDASPSYTGKYELAVQGQFFQFNARNAADNSFATLARFLGGTFNDGGSAPTGNQNVTRFELFGSPDLAAGSYRDSLRLRFTAKYDNSGSWSDANVWDFFSDQTGATASSNTFKLMDHSGNVVLQAVQGGGNLDAVSGLKIGGGTEITSHLSASATLDFANQAIAGCEELSITVTGAADGNACAVGVPNAANVAGSFFTCRVSATNTVQVKHCTVSSGNPASGTFRVSVWQY